MKNSILLGDCLELMKDIPDKSIDMILCDLPYGTTACKWDVIIPFEPLWDAYKRIIKDNGAIVLFGSEPFSSHLRMSNLKMFRYDWIWEKSKAANFNAVQFQPLKRHETISIFGNFHITYVNKNRRAGVYNPQFIEACEATRNRRKYNIKPQIQKGERFGNERHYTHSKVSDSTNNILKETTLSYPKSIINIKNENSNIHPTQKPVALMEYLIMTYTNENDLVLDNCIGSGTTAIACINTNRNFIGMEKEPKYFEIATKRVNDLLELNKQRLFNEN